MVGVFTTSHICSTTFLKNAINSGAVTQVLVAGLQHLYPNGIPFQNILLTVTDVALYMVKAMREFTACLATKAIHVTCIAHGLHRVVKCVRQSYTEIDLFVSILKKVVIKAPSRRVLFVESTGLPLPPELVIVRWGTWTSDVGYYAKHFNSVKEFTLTLSDDCRG